MPTDNAAVFELVQAIGDLVHSLPYNGASLTSAKRVELVRNAEMLAIAAREPAENLYFQSTQVRSFCESKSFKNNSYLHVSSRQPKTPPSELPSTWECLRRFLPPAAASM